ncbi:MAG TPA: xylose isomerase, partial [Planctomycetota bacterium]|nr:xylose isomerase [Planctomycetota bacterium]
MRFHHPAHPGRSVRLAYCLNLHPADTLEGLFEGLRGITLPLRERLARGRTFGVGMYVPAKLAEELASGEDWRALKGFLEEHDLDPFTWNAFPYGGFGADGLKARVFEPTWADPERTFYTQRVGKLAGLLASPPRAGEHL